MSRTLRFEELDSESAEQNAEQAVRSKLGVTIEVAGAGKTESKTIQCELDQRGLIKLSFKEGGQLPVVLQGRFTSLKDVKAALSVWKSRRDKEFNLDEGVSAPHAGGGQNIDDLVEEAAQKTPPGFQTPLDDALVAAEDVSRIGAVTDAMDAALDADEVVLVTDEDISE